MNKDQLRWMGVGCRNMEEQSDNTELWRDRRSKVVELYHKLEQKEKRSDQSLVSKRLYYAIYNDTYDEG